jgi:hypothetical protein
MEKGGAVSVASLEKSGSDMTDSDVPGGGSPRQLACWRQLRPVVRPRHRPRRKFATQEKAEGIFIVWPDLASISSDCTGDSHNRFPWVRRGVRV